MITVSPEIEIHESDIKYDFIRSSGPGGQNVNKVSSAVQLRFDLHNAKGISDEMKRRISKLAGRKMTDHGVLIIEAKRYRTQERNKTDALDRLIKIIERASTKPKKRLSTKPSKLSKEKRLRAKHKKSQKKQLRSPVDATRD